MTDGIFSTSWKSVTIGIDPPERINTVSLERVMQSFSRRLDEPVVGANHACGALAPSLDLDVDPLGRVFLDERRVAPKDVIRILVRHQPHGNFC